MKTVVNKPLVETLLHDDVTRLAVCFSIVILSVIMITKITKYFLK